MNLIKQLAPKNNLKHLFSQEQYEPRLSWGLRMGVTTALPLIWGTLTNRFHEGEMIALAAECLCWVDLKGSVAQRFRLLFAASFVLLLAMTFGGILANTVWLVALFGVFIGFVSGLFKNLGDRGAGLAFILNVIFIVSAVSPFSETNNYTDKLLYSSIGCLVAILISYFFIAFQPSQFPFRRFVSQIWLQVSDLSAAIAKGWDGSDTRASVREIYKKEVTLRQIIDKSFHFYDKLADEVSDQKKQEQNLAQLRKCASLIGSHLVAIADELQNVKVSEVDPELSVRLYGVLRSFSAAATRLAQLTVEIKEEELLLFELRLKRLSNHIDDIEQLRDRARFPEHFEILIKNFRRAHRLMLRSSELLRPLTDDKPTYKSYSFLKTIYLLQPKHLWNNLKILLNFNTLTTRYALRLGLAQGLAIWIWKYYNIPFGHWMPFTVSLIVQPYFGATLKKGFERVIGTILGAILAGMMLNILHIEWVEIIILFISSVLMVYFAASNYVVSSFFITLSTILLFDINDAANPMLIIDRVATTVAGSVLAIVAGYALLPTWDKEHLPKYLQKAFEKNFLYFMHYFYNYQKNIVWIKFKQQAEIANSNAFDSFNRFMQEPIMGKSQYKRYYQLMIQNTRITRDMNSIMLHEDKEVTEWVDQEKIEQRVGFLRNILQQNIQLLLALDPSSNDSVLENTIFDDQVVNTINKEQFFYLEKMLVEAQWIQDDLFQWYQSTVKELPDS